MFDFLLIWVEYLLKSGDKCDLFELKFIFLEGGIGIIFEGYFCVYDEVIYKFYVF